MSNLLIDKLTVSEKKHDLCNFFSQKVVLYHLENIISFRIRNNPPLQRMIKGQIFAKSLVWFFKNLSSSSLDFNPKDWVNNGMESKVYTIRLKRLKGLENLSLWQRLNSFIWFHSRNSKLLLFSSKWTVPLIAI